MDVLTRGLAPDKLGRVWEEELTIARRSEEHTSELQSLRHLVCRLLLEKKKKFARTYRSKSEAAIGTRTRAAAVIQRNDDKHRLTVSGAAETNANRRRRYEQTKPTIGEG